VVLLDDFRGKVAYDEVLRLTDGRREPIEVKGGMRETKYDYVVITSNTDPSAWWPGTDLDPLKARVLEGGGMYVEFREAPSITRNGVRRVGGMIQTPVWHRPEDINRTLPKLPDPPRPASARYLYTLYSILHICVVVLKWP